jgi:hypothetical protein
MGKRDDRVYEPLKSPGPENAEAYRKLGKAILQRYIDDNLCDPHPDPETLEMLCAVADTDAQSYVDYCKFIYGPSLPFRRVGSPRELPRALIKKAPSR